MESETDAQCYGGVAPAAAHPAIADGGGGGMLKRGVSDVDAVSSAASASVALRASSIASLYSTASTSARHDASMMFVPTPTVEKVRFAAGRGAAGVAG